MNRGKFQIPMQILKDRDKYEKWISEGNKIKVMCEHPNHTQRRKLFHVKNMFYQPFKMTKKETLDAIKEFDVNSLNKTGRWICKNCYLESWQRGNAQAC